MMAVHEIDPRTLGQARRGDERAFAALVRHYDPGLRALAFRLLGDRSRMDDALQETYVKAYRALPRFRGEASVGTWLYRIAYRACLDELARERPATDLETLRGRAAPTGDPAERAPLRQSLAYALASLPPEDRAAVLLVDADGFDYRSAAQVLGVPEGTIGSRLHRARAALRRALGETRTGASRR
jgi:RNA polymerase sigma-70 factor (ECF subfamily)